MRGIANFIAGARQAWGLSRPYFSSEERWGARGLLAAIIALNLLMVFINLILNYWNRDFFNFLQQYNEKALIALLFSWQPMPGMFGFMPGFVEIVTVYVFVAVYSTYLTQMLSIRWRRWMTTKYVDNWLSDRAYYNVSLHNTHAVGMDNPDQRISDDLRFFTQNMLNIGISFLSNLVTFCSFVAVLFAISGSIRLFGVTIPGYMLWVAVLYAMFGTGLTHLIGRRLIPLSFLQQKLEANFRYNLVRVRDNPEAIALYAGENDEKLGLGERFEAVVTNFWAIMRRTKALNFFTASFGQVAIIFPLVVALPRFLSHAIGLGGLTQIQDAFAQVQGSLSWFVSVYSDSATNQDLVNLRATIVRLHGFKEAVAAGRAASGAGPQVQGQGSALNIENLTLSLPDGRKLLQNASLSLPPGEPVVLTGASGSGKSTLFRAIAGIWPFGEGHVSRPTGSAMFLPQKPYFPLGSLRRAITYPGAETGASEPEITAALADVGLEHLTPRLDETENWSQILSGGEQQRLALTRALLARPDWLFLDEATSALDGPMDRQIQAVLKNRLPGTTVVAITHREGLAPAQRHITLAGGVLSTSELAETDANLA